MPKIAQAEPQDTLATDRIEKLTKVARQTTDSTTDAAHEVEKFTKVARQAAGSTANAARDVIERARTTSAAVLEDRRESAVHASEALTKSGQTLLDLCAQQTRHSFETATAFTRMFNWTELFEAQRDYFTASLERSRQLNESYREMLQVGLKSTVLPARR